MVALTCLPHQKCQTLTTLTAKRWFLLFAEVLTKLCKFEEAKYSSFSDVYVTTLTAVKLQFLRKESNSAVKTSVINIFNKNLLY